MFAENVKKYMVMIKHTREKFRAFDYIFSLPYFSKTKQNRRLQPIWQNG